MKIKIFNYIVTIERILTLDEKIMVEFKNNGFVSAVKLYRAEKDAGLTESFYYVKNLTGHKWEE